MPELHAQVQAWAKINLDLRILAREESGFHQIETIFQRISLADAIDLRVTTGAGIALTCAPAVNVPANRNLAYRAASANSAAAAWPASDRCIQIAITKQIPTGAGLGGGSADAGAVLRALNALNPAPLPATTLLTIAAMLGADVPFLTSERAAALAWGRGERLFALPPLPRRELLLATFRDGVNTAMAYRALAEWRARGDVAAVGSFMHDAPALGDWNSITQLARNDFEGPVFALRPDILAVYRALSSSAPTALVRMSGSGATVFAIFATPSSAVANAPSPWPASAQITPVHAATLEQVPAVAILSPTSRPR